MVSKVCFEFMIIRLKNDRYFFISREYFLSFFKNPCEKKPTSFLCWTLGPVFIVMKTLPGRFLSSLRRLLDILPSPLQLQKALERVRRSLTVTIFQWNLTITSNCWGSNQIFTFDYATLKPSGISNLYLSPQILPKDIFYIIFLPKVPFEHQFNPLSTLSICSSLKMLFISFVFKTSPVRIYVIICVSGLIYWWYILQ